MSPALAQRVAALAGVALLAAIVSLAIGSPRGESETLADVPKPVAVPWYRALAGVAGEAAGRKTSCGHTLTKHLVGIADPVLPCGVKIYVAYRDGPRVLTQVIDRRAVPLGRRFDLTPALADKLGVRGVQWVRWVYAGLPESDE